jgi:hypothetical protein
MIVRLLLLFLIIILASPSTKKKVSKCARRVCKLFLYIFLLFFLHLQISSRISFFHIYISHFIKTTQVSVFPLLYKVYSIRPPLGDFLKFNSITYVLFALLQSYFFRLKNIFFLLTKKRERLNN